MLHKLATPLATLMSMTTRLRPNTAMPRPQAHERCSQNPNASARLETPTTRFATPMRPAREELRPSLSMKPSLGPRRPWPCRRRGSRRRSPRQAESVRRPAAVGPSCPDLRKRTLQPSAGTSTSDGPTSEASSVMVHGGDMSRWSRVRGTRPVAAEDAVRPRGPAGWRAARRPLVAAGQHDPAAPVAGLLGRRDRRPEPDDIAHVDARRRCRRVRAGSRDRSHRSDSRGRTGPGSRR